MEQLVNYVKPELLIVAVVLYFMGLFLKEAQPVKDKYIPLILGGISVVVCAVYVFASSEFKSVQDAVMGIFTAFTQGILTAGLSTYINQVIKQLNKEE